jgi:flagellar M-ring protein FliF
MQQVTVLDSSGALLAGSGGSPSGGQAMEAQDDSESQVELRIQSRISELLGQVLEDGEYRVSVDVDLDFDSVRQVNERPLGDDTVIARKRVNSLADQRDDSARSSNEDVEYLHGTVREEISRAPGKIQRMSVAVILPTSLGEGDVTRIESLVAAAAGINEMRGDRLEVSRLGRGEAFSQRRVVIDETATEAEGGPVRIGFDAAALPALPKILFFIVLGLLLGVIIALAIQKKPAALSPTEREAVLGKMRAWLAEGNLPQ